MEEFSHGNYFIIVSMNNQPVETTIPFSTENIIRAFEVLGNNQNPKETILQAD